MISAGVMVMGSLSLWSETKSPSPDPTSWWMCNLVPWTGRTSWSVARSAVLLQESVSFRFVSEEQDRPGVGGAAASKRLVTVIPVLQEVLAVAVRHQQRWRVPSMLDAVLHRLDVGLPDLLGHGDDHVVIFGTGHRCDPVELETNRSKVGRTAEG